MVEFCDGFITIKIINSGGTRAWLFSEQLSKFRKEANLTQEGLAEKCDVSRQAVAKWETGVSQTKGY